MDLGIIIYVAEAVALICGTIVLVSVAAAVGIVIIAAALRATREGTCRGQ